MLALFLSVLICIPTFYFLRWLFGKFINNSKRRHLATSIVALIFVPLLYLGVLAIFFSILFSEPTKQFDSVSWRTDKFHRYQMADAIIRDKLFLHKDSNQVKSLLGEKAYEYSDTITHTIRWNYDMGGGGGGLGFLLHSLTITFREGKVIEVHHNEFRD